ncbi:hypothetical protein CMK11_21340 [Candidatus Poribacteria bacterium]|nr:hypothetical protein [Candidatus Poribacteria bacterium]
MITLEDFAEQTKGLPSAMPINARSGALRVSVLAVFVVLALAIASAALPADPTPDTTLTGVVREALSAKPVSGVVVTVAGISDTTDGDGEFVIVGAQVGTHIVSVASEGFGLVGTVEALVSSGRVPRLEIDVARIPTGPRDLGPIVVTGVRGADTGRTVNSTETMTRREMQGQVGAVWDPQRILGYQPGATTSSDMTNNIVVRGGNPSENQIFVDHIEMPNISHLSWQGETGGGIGIINLDFVRDATFHTGGFPAEYGGKLSSVLDIRFREGNRERLGGEMELSMAGVGGGLEGPLQGGKGSWVASYRKSFLDLLKEPIRLAAVPHYEDAHGKIVLDLSPKQTISVLGIVGRDDIDIKWVRDADRAVVDGLKYAVGANWRVDLGANAASRVTLSQTGNYYDVQVYQVDDDPAYTNDSAERETTIEGVIDIGESYADAWQIGAMARLVDFRHTIDSRAWRGFSENQGRAVWLGDQEIDERHEAFQFAGFLHRDMTIADDVTVRFGVRAQRSALTDSTTVDPRFGVAWRITPAATFSVTGGQYHQPPTYVELTLDKGNFDLKDAQARHMIVGLEVNLAEGARISAEGYRKLYRDVPVFEDADSIAPSGRMVNDGEKRVSGVDLLLEKRAKNGAFGSVVATLSESRSLDALGEWYADDFDYRKMLTLSGGVPLVGGWRASARWRYVGGRPFTQFPVVELEDGSYDLVPDFESRNQVRYPDYHRLDLRMDRRLDFAAWGTSLFFEVQNVYSRENVFSRQFDRKNGRFLDILQFQRLGIVGLIADF